ncbi:hypothetical protein ACKC9G_18345 [Pokkaliibacter sp. CJK22405]|uniref:hypothetical protein n=1 Tax=Pokkaliibacter sp. CJK22405 TaxID=3384615 RepID=UPI0039846793
MTELNKLADQFPLLKLHLSTIQEREASREWCWGFLDALLLMSFISSDIQAAAKDQVDAIAYSSAHPVQLDEEGGADV